MGLARLISRFVGRLPVSDCRGDGSYAVLGVGAEDCQEAYVLLCGEKQARAADLPVSALLVPDDGHPKDKAPIRIEVRGRTMGFLGQPEARRLRTQLKKLGYGECAVKVAARIRGGVRRKSGRETPYLIALDLPDSIAGTRVAAAKPQRKGK